MSGGAPRTGGPSGDGDVLNAWDAAFGGSPDASPAARAACVARLRAAALTCMLAMQPGAPLGDDAVAALRAATADVAAVLARLRCQEALARVCGNGAGGAAEALKRLSSATEAAQV